MRVKGRNFFGGTSFGFLLAVLFAASLGAAPQLNPADPIGFFTNLASRLLKMEMNLDLNHLQIYPTNQYTPAVHRLLQVSANIYEATTNRFDDDYPHLPTLFRPRFTNENGSVFISGYVEETNSAFLESPLRDLISPAAASAVQPDDRILGIPIVIGAKKGLPNFNEFSMETVFQFTRKLELVKSAPGGGNVIFQTNQLFVIGISNVFGAEFWNSYSSNYTRPVEIAVTNFCVLALTNDYGFLLTSNLVASGDYQTNLWLRWNPKFFQDTSFLVPLRTNHIMLPDSAYRFGTHSFDGQTMNFERPSGYAFPRWGLALTNRVVALIKDTASGRIIDYVQLNGMISYQNLSLYLAQRHNAIGFAGVWGTNAPSSGTLLLSGLPGIVQQIQISKGEVEQGGNWQNQGLGQPSGATRDQAIANFIAFFEPSHLYIYQPGDGRSYLGSNSALTAITPFTPTRKWSLPMIWQANDPLIHYTSSDIRNPEQSGVPIAWTPPSAVTNTVANLGRVNSRYRPWGGNVFLGATVDPYRYDLRIKDPWNRWWGDRAMPVAAPLDLVGLSRVHRGTPWQTLYFKSTDVGDSDWKSWTGNMSTSDAQHSKPIRDWPLVALVASLLNTNRPQDLLSINLSDTNAWLAALDGFNVLTNSASDDYLLENFWPLFDEAIMTSDSPQAAVIADAIFATRAAAANGRFHSVGDLLAVSKLSNQSPWLNQSSSTQLELGLTDEAYERISAQLLSRVRADSLGRIIIEPEGWQVQFTGLDGFSYAIERSTNLLNWLPIATNQPTDGWFSLPILMGTEPAFYRSVALP